VDYASAATLQQSIQDAIGRGVFLFNFSFTLPGDAQTNNALRNLKIDIRDNWKDQLFVVAAGNESSDLKDNEVLPIRWVGEDVKNIIGVGVVIVLPDNQINALPQHKIDNMAGLS